MKYANMEGSLRSPCQKKSHSQNGLNETSYEATTVRKGPRERREGGLEWGRDGREKDDEQQ